MSEAKPPPRGAGALKRALGLTLLTLYGLGTTIGAGIYVLIGSVAGAAGYLSPWSFLFAGVLAGLAAFSFAELAKRYPRAAGEAHYVLVAFGRQWLSLLVGATVVGIAVVSAAAVARGAAGYLALFLALPFWLLVVVTVAVLALLCAWGIKESARFAGIMTLIEIGGIVMVIVAGLLDPATAEVDAAALLPHDIGDLEPILGGTLIAFFAFVGFEHMVNVAEEVREPQRVLPRAILLTLLVTSALYILLAIVAVTSMEPSLLAASDAPLVLLWSSAAGSPWLLGAIGSLATLNGLLAMLILGSRVLYGLARQGSLPRVLGRVHARRGTPLLATFLVALAVLAAALSLPIAPLAELSSLLTLAVFASVAAALVRVQAREARPAHERLLAPLALLAILAFLGYELLTRLT